MRLNPEILPWIDAMAEQLVTDYLAREARNDALEPQPRPNPVPLPDLDQAA